MSRESLERFRRLVIQSPDLQEALREARQPAPFYEACSRLASAHGLEVDPDDVARFDRDRQLDWLRRWA